MLDELGVLEILFPELTALKGLKQSAKWHIYDAKDGESWDKEDEWFESLSEPNRTEVMQKSWERIFDVKIPDEEYASEDMNDEGFTGYIQATFWELKKEQVIKMWRVKGRYKTEKTDEKEN